MKSLHVRPPHLRVQRILKLAALLTLPAGIAVFAYYTVVMRLTFFHRITFAGQATNLGIEDRQQIRSLLLDSDIILQPPHTLIRYTITFDSLRYTTNSKQSAWYSGRIVPNNPNFGEGIVAVSKQSGKWEIVFLATGA